MKTPLAALVLMLIGAAICWAIARRVRYLLPSPSRSAYSLPSMAGHINIGTRHVLPIYLAFAILAGDRAGAIAGNGPPRTQAIAGVLTLWLLAGRRDPSPRLHPLLQRARPPSRPVLLDSDYDWGQDNKRLAARLHELGATQVNYGYVDGRDHAFLEAFPGLPHIEGIDPTRPAEGWTAVCPTMNRTTQYGLEYRYPNLRPWFEVMPPREQVGTITLYYVPPGTLR